jgi:GNAT superfamily N-acetyltransferase
VDCHPRRKIMEVGVRVRDARPADAPVVGRLLVELGYPQPVAELGVWIEDLVGQDTDIVLVAEMGEDVVGVVSLHVIPFFNEGQCRGRVTALVVDSDRRGQGVGGVLLRAVEAAARRCGCKTMELTSSVHRHDAHRFYREAGYQDVPHRFLKQLDTGHVL